MLEGMLLLLLALSGSGRSPSAAVPSPATPEPVIGVWRGTWTTPATATPVPIEAIVTSVSRDGKMVAVIAAGNGRARRMTRLTGKLEPDGAAFALPNGGFLRLAAASQTRLIGLAKGVSSDGSLPGDGTLALTRVWR
ncbi:MAG TPA: hypothetical protein VGT02_17735 [Methylomirabilota bacterium]|jgi:hypothetical protein|nr:hypothetical protein [Methylomirabilota bacterium]